MSKRLSHDRLIEQLHQLEFVTRSIVFTPTDVTIKLQIVDLEIFFKLLSAEANKFLLACLISFQRSNQNQNDNAAWQTVEHYYAAYYAIHYILRVTGVSLTTLDSKSIDRILNNNLGATPAEPVPGGLYTLSYHHPTETLTLHKKRSRTGGSHQDAWALWVEFIDKMKLTATTDDVEYASESLHLTTHRSFIVRSTGHYNPPELRGEINYQFKGGSWIFEKDSLKSIRKLQLDISSIYQSSSTPLVNTEKLIANNKLIINLARQIFLHSSDKYPTSICRSLKNKYASYID